MSQTNLANSLAPALSGGFIEQIYSNLPKDCDWLFPVLQIADIVQYPVEKKDAAKQYKVVWSDGLNVIDGALSVELSQELVGDTDPESNKYAIVTLDKYRRLQSRTGRIHIFAEESGSIFMHPYIIGDECLHHIATGDLYNIVNQKLDRILQKWRPAWVPKYVTIST